MKPSVKPHRIIARGILPFATALLFWSLPLFTKAQYDLTLYQMEEVPQRIFLNPSFIPVQSNYLGIPLLSGIRSSFTLPLSYHDAIYRDKNDSLELKPEVFIDKLTDNGSFRLYNTLDIVTLGLPVAGGNFFLGFSIRERFSQHLDIPFELPYVLWYGNAAPEVFGQTINISPAIDMVAYDEWGISLSGYAAGDRITWGARLKYLSGRFNIDTRTADLEVYSDTSTYDVYIRSNMNVRTSGIDNIEKYVHQTVPALVFPGNNGAGADIGVTCRINNQFMVSAAVTDIGFIRWKKNTLTLISHTPGEEFLYSGFTLKDFVEMLDDLNGFGKKITDSILDLADIDSVYGEAYTTWLPVRYNLGGSWALNERHGFNLLAGGVSWSERFYPALSLSYRYQLPRRLSISLSYNLFDRQYTNFGAGIAITAGPVQLYAVTDNLPGILFYQDTDNYSVQFGINVLLRTGKNNNTAQPVPSSTDHTE